MTSTGLQPAGPDSVVPSGDPPLRPVPTDNAGGEGKRMTTLEKLKRCSFEVVIREIDGVLWGTNGYVMVRLDGQTADEGGCIQAEPIARELSRYRTALETKIPARLGSLGESGGLIRKIEVGISEPEEIHYINEGYLGLLRGEPYWIPGNARGFGPGHALVGLVDGELAYLVRGMHDADVAANWEPITTGYDPVAEAEYYRELALYPDEEDEDEGDEV